MHLLVLFEARNKLIHFVRVHFKHETNKRNNITNN